MGGDDVLFNSLLRYPPSNNLDVDFDVYFSLSKLTFSIKVKQEATRNKDRRERMQLSVAGQIDRVMRKPRPLHWNLMLIVTAMLSVSARATVRHFVQAAFQFRTNSRRYGLVNSPGMSLFCSSSSDDPFKSVSTASSDDPLVAFRNPKNRNDQVFSAISADGGIKVTACTVRNMVNDMMIQHTMTEVPTEVSWSVRFYLS